MRWASQPSASCDGEMLTEILIDRSQLEASRSASLVTCADSRPMTFEQQLLAKAKDAIVRTMKARTPKEEQAGPTDDTAEMRVAGYGDILQLSA